MEIGFYTEYVWKTDICYLLRIIVIFFIDIFQTFSLKLERWVWSGRVGKVLNGGNKV